METNQIMEITRIVKNNINEISKKTLNNFIKAYEIDKSKITNTTKLEVEIFNLFMFDYTLHSNPIYVKNRNQIVFNIIDDMAIKYKSLIRSDLEELIEYRFNNYAEMPQKDNNNWKRKVNELLIRNLKGSLNEEFMKNYPIIPDASFITNPIKHFEESLNFANLQVNDANEIIKLTKKINGEKKEGCYIATMVYKDYNSNEVIILRQYRDDTLSKSILGKIFIKIYYTLSPTFVKLFKNNSIVNSLLKNILDMIIQKLK